MATIWPPVYDPNGVVWIERGTYLLCFAVQYEGTSKVHTFALPDYANFHSDIHDDTGLTNTLSDVLHDVDIVVAHNGQRFDLKIIRTRMLINGLRPPPPVKVVDTLNIAKGVFKFDSNKLDAIGQATNTGRKIPNTGADLWRRCYHGDPKAFETMRRYCAQDTRLLGRVYGKLAPWNPNPPNLAAFVQRPCCPVCMSDHVNRQGMKVLRTRRVQQFQCQSCGHWFNESSIPKTKRAA